MIPAWIAPNRAAFYNDQPLLVGVRAGTSFFWAAEYKLSRCRVLVCPICGYTELLTLEPGLL